VIYYGHILKLILVSAAKVEKGGTMGRKAGARWSHIGITNNIILQKVEKVEQGGATPGPQIKLYRKRWKKRWNKVKPNWNHK
jgi:hypothetical protein